MTNAEREMLLEREASTGPDVERFTSLQPTYEDTVAPDPEGDWELED